MRLTYSSIRDGESYSSYGLSERDLEQIVAEHFGFDPQTVTIWGLEMVEGEFQVSGMSVSADEEVSSAPR